MAEVSAELSTDSENVRPQSDNTSSDNVADNTSEEVTFWTVSGNEIFNVDVLQDSEGMETEKTTNNEKSIDNNDITENSKDNNATPEKSNDNNNMPEKPDDSQSSEKDNTQSEDVLEENMDPHVRDSTPETLSADESDCNNVSPVGLLQSKSSPNFSIYKKDPAVKAVKQSRLDAISQRLTQLQSGEKKQPEESENFKVPSDLPPGTIVVEPAEVPMDMDQGRPLSGNSKIDVSVTPSLNASNVDGGNTDKNADSVVNDSVSKETDKSEQETSKHDNTVKDNQVTEKEIISSSGNTTEETKKKGWADMVDDYSDLAAAYGLGSNLNDSTVDKGDMAGALSSSISHPLTVQTSSASQMGMNLPVTANSGVGYISVPQLYGHSNSTASALFPSPVQLQPPPQQLLTTAQNQLLSALQAPPAIYNPKIPNSTVFRGMVNRRAELAQATFQQGSGGIGQGQLLFGNQVISPPQMTQSLQRPPPPPPPPPPPQPQPLKVLQQGNNIIIPMTQINPNQSVVVKHGNTNITIMNGDIVIQNISGPNTKGSVIIQTREKLDSSAPQKSKISKPLYTQHVVVPKPGAAVTAYMPQSTVQSQPLTGAAVTTYMPQSTVQSQPLTGTAVTAYMPQSTVQSQPQPQAQNYVSPPVANVIQPAGPLIIQPKPKPASQQPKQYQPQQYQPQQNVSTTSGGVMSKGVLSNGVLNFPPAIQQSNNKNTTATQNLVQMMKSLQSTSVANSISFGQENQASGTAGSSSVDPIPKHSESQSTSDNKTTTSMPIISKNTPNDTTENTVTNPSDTNPTSGLPEKKKISSIIYKCSKCCRLFSTETSYEFHVESCRVSKALTNIVKPHACSWCNEKFEFKSSMILHEQRICAEKVTGHARTVVETRDPTACKTAPNPSECTRCLLLFPSVKDLEEHCKNVHDVPVSTASSKAVSSPAKKTIEPVVTKPVGKKYKCYNCTKQFAYYSALRTHTIECKSMSRLAIAIKKKNVQKKQTKKRDMKKIKKKKGGMPRVLREVTYDTKTVLAKYGKLDPKKKGRPHICVTCDKNFGSEHCLFEHIKSHLKPFSCSVCGWRNARNDNVARHIERQHNGPRYLPRNKRRRRPSSPEFESESEQEESDEDTIEEVNQEEEEEEEEVNEEDKTALEAEDAESLREDEKTVENEKPEITSKGDQLMEKETVPRKTDADVQEALKEKDEFEEAGNEKSHVGNDDDDDAGGMADDDEDTLLNGETGKDRSTSNGQASISEQSSAASLLHDALMKKAEDEKSTLLEISLPDENHGSRSSSPLSNVTETSDNFNASRIINVSEEEDEKPAPLIFNRLIGSGMKDFSVSPYRPFPCPMCGKAFKRKNNLNDHIASHIRPFRCKVCDWATTRKKYLERHLVTKHNFLYRDIQEDDVKPIVTEQDFPEFLAAEKQNEIDGCEDDQENEPLVDFYGTMPSKNTGNKRKCYSPVRAPSAKRSALFQDEVDMDVGPASRPTSSHVFTQQVDESRASQLSFLPSSIPSNSNTPANPIRESGGLVSQHNIHGNLVVGQQSAFLAALNTPIPPTVTHSLATQAEFQNLPIVTNNVLPNVDAVSSPIYVPQALISPNGPGFLPTEIPDNQQNATPRTFTPKVIMQDNSPAVDVTNDTPTHGSNTEPIQLEKFYIRVPNPLDPKSGDIRPFMCTYNSCNARFKSMNHLRDHIYTHLRPYVCDVCGAGYARTDYLAQHMFKVHKVAVSDEDMFRKRKSANYKAVKGHAVMGRKKKPSKSPPSIMSDESNSSDPPSKQYVLVQPDGTSVMIKQEPQDTMA